ncbi:unnamed protein product [Pedinophyceae sp. YPF-701]|nr:unnamed protein product [Pedinophyceae sp. YPF-701]
MALGPKHDKVVVHPLVLLSVVDHYNRVAKDTKKRVVGILLGSVSKGVVDVTNSFAVPFEEDEKDPSIWYLDHSYLESMFRMFKKVNAREVVIGWYSSGPRLCHCDMEVHRLVQRFVPDQKAVLVVCEVQPKELGLPVSAYVAEEDIREDVSSGHDRTIFANVPTEVGATEAEEIGVEHLLRDVKDASVSTLTEDISAKISSLRGLVTRLRDVHSYLGLVAEGKLPVNHEISGQLQDVFNLLPNLAVDELARALAHTTNDMSMAVYLSSLIRSVLALHNLIDNKETNRRERAEAEKRDSKAREDAVRKKGEKEGKGEGEGAKEGAKEGEANGGGAMDTD